MNILDENIIENQCQLLRKWRIQFRQIGYDTGRFGMKDQEIIALLNNTKQPTFFSRDDDFYDFKLCHSGYCLVYLDINKGEVANFIRRFLRHNSFRTKSKRMGKVARISHARISLWHIHEKDQVHVEWTA